jgi:hypothetical protein
MEDCYLPLFFTFSTIDASMFMPLYFPAGEAQRQYIVRF